MKRWIFRYFVRCTLEGAYPSHWDRIQFCDGADRKEAGKNARAWLKAVYPTDTPQVYSIREWTY
jgi:hypothetical protein